MGPYNDAVMMASEATNTPYLVLTSPEVQNRKSPATGIYLLPSERMMHAAARDLVVGYEWNDVAILYDNPRGVR